MATIRQTVKKLVGKRCVQYLYDLKRRTTFRIYGNQALSKIEKSFKQSNVDYWLMFGTLLGAYREKGFIKHDDDIDIGMMSCDITQSIVATLENEGFVLKRIKETNDHKYRMASFSFHNITVDFYGFVKSDDETIITGFVSYPLHDSWAESEKLNLFRVYLVSFPFKGFIKTKFNKMLLPIPQNTPCVLEGLYGASYMTPQKGVKGFKSPISRILPIEEAKAYMIDKEVL